ncbi:MAG: hypothetical protein JNG89_10260 [Planctomycetaceae bacterium]|nr:hypothetical protein [Planctomycetaceae bacterium]
MTPTRRAIVASGLCLASALTLPGCAAERSAQTTPGWTRLWSPFRSKAIAEQEAEATDEAQQALVTPPVPPQWSPSDPSDSYYAPGGIAQPLPARPLVPPPAPPALEPGYLSEDADSATQSQTGLKSQGKRPARLRDVFENLGKRQQDSRPTIPLDEPVANRLDRATTHVVGFERTEPVVLGKPEFVE